MSRTQLPTTKGDSWDEMRVATMMELVKSSSGEDPFNGASMAFGVTLTLVGSLFTSFGLVLQKLSWMDEGNVNLFCRWRWWAGFLFLVVVTQV